MLFFSSCGSQVPDGSQLRGGSQLPGGLRFSRSDKRDLSWDCELIRKKFMYKTVLNVQKYFFHVNLLINIVYSLYINSYMHIYTVNQAICVSKL